MDAEMSIVGNSAKRLDFEQFCHAVNIDGKDLKIIAEQGIVSFSALVKEERVFCEPSSSRSYSDAAVTRLRAAIHFCKHNAVQERVDIDMCLNCCRDWACAIDQLENTKRAAEAESIVPKRVDSLLPLAAPLSVDEAAIGSTMSPSAAEETSSGNDDAGLGVKGKAAAIDKNAAVPTTNTADRQQPTSVTYATKPQSNFERALQEKRNRVNGLRERMAKANEKLEQEKMRCVSLEKKRRDLFDNLEGGIFQESGLRACPQSASTGATVGECIQAAKDWAEALQTEIRQLQELRQVETQCKTLQEDRQTLLERVERGMFEEFNFSVRPQLASAGATVGECIQAAKDWRNALQTEIEQLQEFVALDSEDAQIVGNLGQVDFGAGDS